MSATSQPTTVVAVLPVSDLLRAVSWYQRLGFRCDVTYEAQGYAILRIDGAELHLTVNPAVDPHRSPAGCYLRVAEAAEVHDRWTALGVPAVAPLVDQPYGIREFATEDLDGNLWRVGSPIPQGGGAAPADPDADGAIDDGSPGTGDHAWREIVSSGTCRGCGLHAAGIERRALAGTIRYEAGLLGTTITEADDEAVRTRPAPATWSAMEYAAHVRDVLAVFTERIVRTQREAEPELSWWDHEAAIEDGFANELEADAVADDLARNGSHLTAALDALDDVDWERSATRRGAEPFTIDLLARFALHEVVHHRVDAERVLDR